MLQLDWEHLGSLGMSREKQFRGNVLLVWNLKILFPVRSKIGERTKVLNQFVIPGFKLVQGITVLKEVNAANCLCLPDVDRLIVEHQRSLASRPRQRHLNEF